MAILSFSGFDPFDALLRLQADLDRHFESPVPGFDLGPSGGNVFPPINVFRSQDDTLVVRAEVAGISPDALSVNVESGRLTISGERAADDHPGASHHRRERQFGKFSRVVQLPRDRNEERATAECRNGVLTVRIPKSEAAQRRTITVERA